MMEMAKSFILIEEARADGEDRMDLSAGGFSLLMREGKVTGYGPVCGTESRKNGCLP